MFFFHRPTPTRIPTDRLRVEEYATRHQKELIAIIRARFAETGTPVVLDDRHKDLIDPDPYWKEEGGEFMVLTFDGHVIGSLAVKPLAEPGRAEFNWFYLDPAYDGKGYSALLYRWAMNWCLGHNVQFVELWTNEKRTRTHHLYKNLGFTEPGVRRPMPSSPGTYSIYFEMQVTPKLIEKLQKRFDRLP